MTSPDDSRADGAEGVRSSEPVTVPRVYPKWVGILLAFILPGSAHFLSGKRRAAPGWYLATTGCGLFGCGMLAIPGQAPLWIGATACIASVAFFLIVVKQSYRHIPRIGLKGWVTVIILHLLLGLALKYPLSNLSPLQITGQSMAPTLLPGDHVIVNTSKTFNAAISSFLI